jgi:hypothetical protein
MLAREIHEDDDKHTSLPNAPSLRQILRHPSVWCLVMARLLATMGNHLTQVHMVAFFIAAGYNPLLAVALVCVAIGCMWGVRLTGGQAHD